MTVTSNPVSTTDAPHQTTSRRTERFEQLSIETPILAAALLALVAVGITNPGLALVLFGLPLAAVLGVGSLAGVARLLSR